MRRSGANEETIAELLGDDDADAFEVWKENEPSLRLFVRLGRCWRHGALGGALGLDRPSVESVMRMTGIKDRDRDEMLADLEVMEDAALEILKSRDGE